jgi:AraC-like DNA-binding protein
MQRNDIEQLLADLHAASGMTVVLFDAQFRAMHSHHVAMGYCSLLHNEQQATEICLRSDMKALHKVQKTGESHVYVCPFGLSTALFPIKSSRKLLGYLYLGGVVPEEGGIEAVLRCVTDRLGEGPSLEALRARLLLLPSATETRFAALCRMAQMMCEYIEQNDLLPMREATIGELTEKYILQNLQSKITLARICLNLHCSKATLTEAFRREYGMTIVQFITEKRMARACSLLSTTQLSVRAIADACGFSGVEYFSAQFKQVFGMSPLAYRKKNVPQN